MCTLVVEIAMLVMGLIGLITGKLTVAKNLRVEGTPARITGIILMLPLPVALGLGFFLGLVLGNSMSLSSIQTIAVVAEILLVLACLGGASLYANANKVREIPSAGINSEPPAVPPAQ